MQIYRSMMKQILIFKTQKAEQKQKNNDEEAFMKGSLQVMNIFKTWKSYDAVLTESGIFLYEEPEGTEVIE